MTAIDGKVEPGWEPVRDAFARNFAELDDVGGSVAVYHRGRAVVDLWGGVADSTTGRAWAEDTAAVVYSTTKGVTATCAHLLAQRGELDLDAPVRSYWPEFAAAGKQDVPVRWLLSHRVGLPTVDAQLSLEQVLAWEPVVEALAAQAPYWEPGTAHGYHAITYGNLVGEVVRRVSGRSIGQFLRHEIADPLDLDVWIGLPDHEEHRVARLEQAAFKMPAEPPTAEMMKMAMAFMDPTSLSMRALSLNGAISGTDPDDAPHNRPEFHRAELPAFGGIATARSLARLYSSLVGETDGIRTLEPATVAAATAIQSEGDDRTLIMPTCFGLGFMLQGGMFPLPDGAFGHYGLGGSVAWAIPGAELAVAYVMNSLQQNLAGDERSKGLADAAIACAR